MADSISSGSGASSSSSGAAASSSSASFSHPASSSSSAATPAAATGLRERRAAAGAAPGSTATGSRDAGAGPTARPQPPRSRDAGAGPKAQAEGKKKKEEEEDKEPTQEELIKHGPSQYTTGTCVEIFGLESWDGKKLNGQKGRVTQYLYDKIRYEVSLGHKKVSVRPVNLKETEKLDKHWTYGNTCRLVNCRDDDSETVRDADGCLGSLMSRNKSGSWQVMANGKFHSLYPEFLRVCTFRDELAQLGRIGQAIQFIVGFISLTIGFGFTCLVVKVEVLRNLNIEHSEEDEPNESWLHMVMNPTVPSQYAATLSSATVVWSFLVLWGTIFCCCSMHRCLWDPVTTFPQIAELSCGKTKAKTTFRTGFGIVAAMVFLSVMLHKVLVLPHLPQMGTVHDDVLFWGLAVVAGLAVMTTILVDVGYTWRTLVHRLGGALVAFATYKHMSTTRQLYLPGVPGASWAWIQMLRDMLPDHQMLEDSEENIAQAALIKSAQEFAGQSDFMRNPYLQFAILARYHILSYWPATIPMLLILPLAVERGSENSNDKDKDKKQDNSSASSLLRSMFAWLQWLLVFLCSLMHLSYIPDLVIASLLPIPGSPGKDEGDW